jgi:tetratricopeptide (TPR) repeat protein
MADDFRKFDELGFPIPPRYEDLKFQDDDSPPRSKINMRAKRLLLVLLLAGIVVPIVFGPKILAAGRHLVAEWLASQAEQKYYEGDLAGALNDLDDAIQWDPTSRNLYMLRAVCREAMNELEGSLEDWNKHIELLEKMKTRLRGRPQHSANLARAYRSRSWIHVRLEHKEKALADATHAVDLFSSPDMWNARAYGRAILGTELDDALADIEKAIQQGGPMPEFLDTRGYVLHLLGRDEAALEDMNRAILITEQKKNLYSARKSPRMSDRDFIRLQQEIDNSLAVMYHHRGLIYKGLGRDLDADKDLSEAKTLGYDPARGVM